MAKSPPACRWAASAPRSTSWTPAKSLCAKGQSGPTINDYADRLLYPLQRVGPRGSGQWKRITWYEAYDQITPRIRKAMAEGKPEEVAIHIGRSRLGEEMGRFLNAIGTPSLFNHRAIFNNDRAVILLNAIVGSIGQPGGYCYGEEPTRVPPRVFPQPSPQPPAPTAKSAIENPPEWPLANKWQRMKVGQIVYDYLKQGRWPSCRSTSATPWPRRKPGPRAAAWWCRCMSPRASTPR